ncbi:MAG TPA: hypothetical protein VFS85_06250, partial [Dongiaceae bacterium]|nr:hypothetical protein [Dongiaceae bacterium]
MRDKKALVGFLLELFVFIAILAIAKALGFFETLTAVGGFVGFWVCPLILAAVHVFVFCRSARMLRMSYVFVIGTLAIIAALSASVLTILAGYPAQGAAAVASLIISCFIVALRTKGLAELAIGESELGRTFSALPAAPGSKYKTIPALEMMLGLGCILLAHVTPISEKLELWAYVPLALCVGSGAV